MTPTNELHQKEIPLIDEMRNRIQVITLLYLYALRKKRDNKKNKKLKCWGMMKCIDI